MTIRAVFFDLGGVILRTEYQAPRQQLAERLGLEYDDLDRLVFNSRYHRRVWFRELPKLLKLASVDSQPIEWGPACLRARVIERPQPN
jgi:FMN phosphatase YigB (HAD superfamily)